VTDPRPGERLLDLVAVMDRLRSPGGCPWDAEQTHHSLVEYLVEEAYETVEAIETSDDSALREELGDLLLQVVFHARIAEEHAEPWSIDDVAAGIIDKLVSRHPHVFGDEARAQDADEVLTRWEGHKRREGRGVLAGVPATLPALLMALRVSQKVRSVGFDWPDMQGAIDKLDEEVAELKAAIASGDAEAVRSEIGDVLFTVANLARIQSIDPEDALRGMLARFKARFQYIERRLAEQGQQVAGTPLATLDALWEEAKAGEVANP